MTPQPITQHIDDALLMAYSAGTLPGLFTRHRDAHQYVR